MNTLTLLALICLTLSNVGLWVWVNELTKQLEDEKKFQHEMDWDLIKILKESINDIYDRIKDIHDIIQVKKDK